MKKLTAILLALILGAGLCACGGSGSSAARVDLDAMAGALLDSGAFSDLLTQPADGVAARLYGFDEADVTEYVLYTGTGATAEEMFLAKASSKDAAARLQQLFLTRVENQKTAFENYVPEELVKLDAAIAYGRDDDGGSYVFFVVAADPSAAQAVIEEYTR